MSSSTPRTQSAILRMRRKSQVYVEIPPSPLHTPRIPSTSLSTVSHLNQPLSPTRSNIAQDALSKKRKLSNPQLPATKKPKVEVTSRPHKENAMAQSSVDAPAVNNQTPNCYCHQCGKKRDTNDMVFCTAKHIIKSGKERPCTSKYCRACIKNRYSHDAESTQALEQRLQKIPSNYTCPKCRDICNCSQCRKAKGLEPLGKQPCSIIQTQQNVQVKVPTKTAHVNAQQSTPQASTSNPVQKPKVVKKPVVKPLPKPKWQSLPVSLSVEDVEARIQIREFVLRFEDTVGRNIGKNNLEELESIVQFEDDEPSPNWVSEGCVKAVILGLLGVLGDEEDSSAAMVIKKATKEIRSSGVNLNKIWSSLAELREALRAPDNDAKSTHSDDSESSEDRIIIDFPDPLPLPEGAESNHNIRSTRSASTKVETSATVTCSYQLVPVVVGLIDTVVESHTIREELEEGVKQGREITRDMREGVKRENEKWEKMKQTHESLPAEAAPAKVKEDRTIHKDAVQGLENALKVVLPACAPRFQPLGTDHDGRVYWALSPGVRDREFAKSLIAAASAPATSKKVRKPIRRPKSAEERAMFKAWSWFLAVSGKRPSDADVDGGESDEEWWVFWEPEEVKKLAGWISGRNGLDVKGEDAAEAAGATVTATGGSNVRNQHLKTLVKNLQEYSTTLEWRCKGEEEML
ncbi:hypothetical protein V5O48_004965 [Marasmius crinis-equi]|uniref:Zinc-finger domain-containing protein n=1 Tax=Marasmius crinis-equi TaxID=585013 RepID=A0ABR3FNM0_9AGAR